LTHSHHARLLAGPSTVSLGASDALAPAIVTRADRSPRPRLKTMRFSRMLLTELGIPRLWDSDVEQGWRFMRFNVFPIFTHILMPGSQGYGAARVPVEGGAVLVSNHLSAMDAPLIGTFSRRAIWFMMKGELADLPIVGEALMWTGGFPICRHACSPEGIRNARELVETGHIVGVFPEGTRQRCGYPSENFQGGAAAIALREKVPVVPCGVESFGWSLRNRRSCCVVYGEPMTFGALRATPRGYRAATELLRREVLRLWRLAAEAVAAGFPARLPDGTPRDRPTQVREFAPVLGNPPRVSGHAKHAAVGGSRPRADHTLTL
jgi:1-acyl-sn-glycerol-3-phosphate acyltransferase